MKAINALLRPRRIAIIGASTDCRKVSGLPLHYLQRHGFDGEIYPVNPQARSIGGLPCYPDIASLPDAPDAAIVLLGADQTVATMAELSRKGTAAAIVLADGFGETGDRGAARQRAMIQAAGPMRILGPNTIGLVNLTDRTVLSASGALEMGELASGGLALISQSGGVLGSMYSRAADRGIAFSKLVATGNEADLDTTDFLEALIDDDATRVIAIYMEGLRRPDAFRRASHRAHAAGKPIVIFKVGRCEAGRQAAASHTGALTGEDRLYDALFRQLGIIRARTLTDFLDIPAALACGRRAMGRKVAILTTTGGVATLLADTGGMAGLVFPAPDAETATALVAKAQLSPANAAENPVDMTLAGHRSDRFRGAIRVLMHSASYDALVVVIGSSSLGDPDAVVHALIEGASDKPVLAYVSPHAPAILRRLNQAGIPAVTDPESCATVVIALQKSGASLSSARLGRTVSRRTDPTLPDTGGHLNEAASKALFAASGIKCVAEIAVSSAEQAERAAVTLAGPVVLKFLDSKVAHKSEMAGVHVGIPASEVASICAQMIERFATDGLGTPEGFLVQRAVTGGLEMILGLYRDPLLGMAILVGMGGIAAELIGDTVVRLLPIDRLDAEAMLDELRLLPLLTGYRGGPRRDTAALVDAIMAFAVLGERLGHRIIEAEINPLFVMPEGEGVIAADGLVILAPEEGRDHLQAKEELPSVSYSSTWDI